MSEATNRIINQKLERYNVNVEDYAVENELTVTITLSEYRDLIKEYATKKMDIEKLRTEKYEMTNENNALKEEIKKLKDLLINDKMENGEVERL